MIALNQFQKNFLLSNGFSEKNIYIQFNFLKQVSIAQIKTESKFIFYAGRLSKEKGINFLLEVFNTLKDIDYKLLIAGDGPLFKELIFKYRTNSNIEFLGPLTNDKVLSYMKNALAVINPTHLTEGQPTVLSEASMMGKVSIFPKSKYRRVFPKITNLHILIKMKTLLKIFLIN